MEAVLGCLCGIFVGIASAGYMFIKPFNEKDELLGDYKRKLRKIKIAVNKQQYGSVENLQNEIKSILSNDDQSEK